MIQTTEFAIFVNGNEVPNTRFSQTIPDGVTRNQDQLVGNATIVINPEDIVTLVNVGATPVVVNANNGALIASINVNKVG